MRIKFFLVLLLKLLNILKAINSSKPDNKENNQNDMIELERIIKNINKSPENIIPENFKPQVNEAPNELIDLLNQEKILRKNREIVENEADFRFKTKKTKEIKEVEKQPEKIENIIQETLKNNPKNIKAILPTLVKIITKNGLLCDFPFVHDNEEYHDKCVLFPDNKYYCKINSDNPQNILLNSERKNENGKMKEFFANFLQEKSNIKLQKTKDGNLFFDECLSLDETQRYLNEIVQENFDFKHKILLDLYSDVNQVIQAAMQEKLNLLYTLMENYCKNKKFDFDCIYDNLILPISKSNEHKNLSDKILEIFKKYQNKLKLFLNNSIKEKFRIEEYEFIKEENLKIGANGKEENYSSIFEDDDKNTISLSLINSKTSTSKMSIKNFIKIVSSVYNICIEECKLVIDYLFVDNFENNFERIKLEILAYLFKLKDFSNKAPSLKNEVEIEKIENQEKKKSNQFGSLDLDNEIEDSDDESEFQKGFFNVEKNIFDKIVYNSTHVQFLNQLHPLNGNSSEVKSDLLQNFLDYKNWSVRYTIHLIYRYLIVEKSFFWDYILKNLNDFKLNRLLKKPTELNDKNQIIRLVKTIPLLMPYYSFSKKMHIQQSEIYSKWNNITTKFLQPLIDVNDTITDFKSIMSYLKEDLIERINTIDRNLIKSKKKLIDSKEILDGYLKKIQKTKEEGSIENEIKLLSYMNNLDYLTNNIYKINYFSQDCHKFIHYNSYFGNYTFGKPIIHYVSLGYDPYFFIEFESDVQIFFTYAFLKFNTKIPIKYTINITSNAILDLYLDDLKVFPDKVQKLNDNFYECMVEYIFTFTSSTIENSYVDMKIKGNFRQTANLIDYKDFSFACNKLIGKVNKFLDFNITRQVEYQKYSNIKSFDVNKNLNNDLINNSEKNDYEFMKLTNNNFAYSKCKEHQFEVSVCFNYNVYNVDCQIATKYLTEKFKNELKNQLYIIESEKTINKQNFKFESEEYDEYLKNEKIKNEKKFHPEKNTENKDNTDSIISKSNKKNKANDENKSNDLSSDKNFLRDMGLIFMKKAEKFCNAQQWDIPTYKCIFRNIGLSEFDSILFKCGAFAHWELVGRNFNDEWIINSNDKISAKKILLGEQFYLENSQFNQINLHYLHYITPSIIRPLSKVNFFLYFNFTETDEFLFSSGDMEYFTVFDKKDLFVKGYPFNSITSYNNKIISNINKDKPYNYEASIFNPSFPDNNFDSEGIVIFGNKFFNFGEYLQYKQGDSKANYSKDTNYVLFSFNKKFSNSQNSILRTFSQKLLKENKGANMFIRKNKLCLTKNLFFSNLSTKSYYIERAILKPFIFAYFKSDFITYKIPPNLDKNVILLRSSPYQTSYNINLSQKSRIYFAIEINDFIEINAPILINDNWKFIQGSDNVIEVLTSDVSKDIVEKKGKFYFYNCVFNSNINPMCKEKLYEDISSIKLSIFYKDVSQDKFNISYNFMDFQSLYASMHLIMIEPLECDLDKNNLDSFYDNVNNHVIFNYEYLPTFNMNITEFKNIIKSVDFELIKLQKKPIEEEQSSKNIDKKERLLVDCEDKKKISKAVNNKFLRKNFNNDSRIYEKRFDDGILEHSEDLPEYNEDEIISLSFLEMKLRDMKNKGVFCINKRKLNEEKQNSNNKDIEESDEINVLSEKFYRNYSHYKKEILENNTMNNLENNKNYSTININKFNQTITFRLADLKLSIETKHEDILMNILRDKFNISAENLRGLDDLKIPKEKGDLIIHYLEKNYTSPKIRANSGGCLFALDRFGNLFLKKIGKKYDNKYNLIDDLEEPLHVENNKSSKKSNRILNITSVKENNKKNVKEESNDYTYNETHWNLIRQNVKYFDLSENILLIMSFDRGFEFQSGISQESQCVISKKKWKNLMIDIPNKIKRFSLSSFDCLWLYDDKNVLHFLNKFNFFEYKFNYIIPTPINDFIENKIKNIYQYMDKLYIITRDNRIHVKKRVFNYEESECDLGEKFLVEKEWNFINANKNSLKYNDNHHNILFSVFKETKNNIKIVLDIDGRIWYRNDVNELMPQGANWAELKYFEKKYDQLRKFLDFDINFNNIYAINPNSKVLVIKNIDVAKLYDK